MQDFSLAMLGCFGLIAMDAIAVDVARREIPDRSCIFLFLLTLSAFVLQPSWLHAASVLVATLLAVLVSLILYRLNLWGGGDVKLAVALSAFVGLPGWSDMWLAIACLAFITMAWAKYRRWQEVAFAPVLVGGALYAMWSGSP